MFYIYIYIAINNTFVVYIHMFVYYILYTYVYMLYVTIIRIIDICIYNHIY